MTPERAENSKKSEIAWLESIKPSASKLPFPKVRARAPTITVEVVSRTEKQLDAEIQRLKLMTTESYLEGLKKQKAEFANKMTPERAENSKKSEIAWLESIKEMFPN